MTIDPNMKPGLSAAFGEGGLLGFAIEGGAVSRLATPKVGYMDVVVGSGQTIVVTNNAQLNGDEIVFQGGVIQAGAPALTISAPAMVDTPGGTFDVNGDALTWAGEIDNGSGAGVLTITDSSTVGPKGVMTLVHSNTYTGGTHVTGGVTVAVSNAAAFGTGSITLDSATVQNASGNPLDFANNFVMGAGGGVIRADQDPDDQIEIDGAITGAGHLTLTNGYFALGGVSSYAGGTLISNNSTVLAGSGTLSHTSDFQIDSGSTLQLNGLSSNTIGSLAGAGQVYDASQGGNPATLTLGDAHSTTFSGQIEDSSVAGGVLSLIKLGSGTFTESGTNLYSGGTTISAGEVAVTNASALGSGAVTFDGGKLAPTTDLTFTNAAHVNSTAGSNGFYLNGHTLTWDGAISDGSSAPTALTVQGSGTLVLGHANTFSGGLDIDHATVHFDNGDELGTGTITFIDNSSSTLDATTAGATITNNISIPSQGDGESTALIEGFNVTLSGAVTGEGFLNLANGASVTLSHPSSDFSGSFSLGAGSTLIAGAADTFGAQSYVSENGDSIINLNGYSQTVSYLYDDDSGSGTIENAGGTAATLTVAHDGRYSGDIVDGGAALALVKQGSGELDLDGVSTYSGGTTLEGGVLYLGSTTIGPFGAITSGAAGTGPITFAGASTLVVDGYPLDQNDALDHTTGELYYAINGFTTGDTIDVQDEGSVDTATYNASAGTLTLTNGGTTEAILHIGTGYAGDTFTAVADQSNNGTAITVSLPAPPSGGGGGGGGGGGNTGGGDIPVQQGGDGNDTLTAGSGADTVYGGGGDDHLNGGTGSAMIYGNAGNDTVDLFAATGSSTVFGGQGNDIIDASQSTHANFVSGDLGNDLIFGGGGNDTLYGGDGVDTIVAGSGQDQLYGNAGGDYIYIGASSGGATVFGGQGDDVIDASSSNHAVFISGDAGVDIILGSKGADTIHGGSGSDTIQAASGSTEHIHVGTTDSSAVSATDMSQLDHVTGFGSGDVLVFDGDPAGTAANTLAHGGDTSITGYAAAYAYAYGSAGHAGAIGGVVEYAVVSDTAGHTYVFAADHAAVELDGLSSGVAGVTSGQLLAA